MHYLIIDGWSIYGLIYGLITIVNGFRHLDLTLCMICTTAITACIFNFQLCTNQMANQNVRAMKLALALLSVATRLRVCDAIKTYGRRHDEIPITCIMSFSRLVAIRPTCNSGLWQFWTQSIHRQRSTPWQSH